MVMGMVKFKLVHVHLHWLPNCNEGIIFIFWVRITHSLNRCPSFNRWFRLWTLLTWLNFRCWCPLNLLDLFLFVLLYLWIRQDNFTIKPITHVQLQKLEIFRHNLFIQSFTVNCFPQCFLDSLSLLLDLLIKIGNISLNLAHVWPKTFNLVKFLSWTWLCNLVKYFLNFQI